MARKARSKLQRREVLRIARKLKAELRGGSNHDIAAVKWQDTLIATFGIRRDRYSSHSYIPKQLFINESEALSLARCDLSRDDYFDMLRQQGKLPSVGQI